MSFYRKTSVALVSLAVLAQAASADVSTIAEAFVDMCPSALARGISPRDLGMVPQVDGMSQVITKELIESMPGVFWRSETTDVRMSLPLGRLSCGVGGAISNPSAALAAFEDWGLEHPARLQIIETQTFGQSSSTAGVLLELCLWDPSDQSENRAIGEMTKGAEGWALNLTLYLHEACRPGS